MLKNSSKKPTSLFRQKVYKVVKTIPIGKTLTYKEVALQVGRAKASRAVGNALSKNTDPKIPCHRVVRSDGRIGGYRSGSRQKTHLLKKEGVLIKNSRVVL